MVQHQEACVCVALCWLGLGLWEEDLEVHVSSLHQFAMDSH